MNLTPEHLLVAVLPLPDEDRFEVAEALLASLRPADQSPRDESWREVIRKRSAELRSGQVRGIPWKQIKAEAFR